MTLAPPSAPGRTNGPVPPPDPRRWTRIERLTVAGVAVAVVAAGIALPEGMNQLNEFMERTATPTSSPGTSTPSEAPPTSPPGTASPSSASPSMTPRTDAAAIALDLGDVGSTGQQLAGFVGPQSSVGSSMDDQIEWAFPNQPGRCAVSIGSSSVIAGGVFYSGLPNDSGWGGAEVAPLPEGAVPHMQALYLPSSSSPGDSWTFYPTVEVGGESLAGAPFTVSVVEQSGTVMTLAVDDMVTICTL